MQPEDSASLQTLLAAVRAADSSAVDVKVLIADNTPGGQRVERLPESIQYRAYPDNPGLVVPYNLAMAQAELEGYQWLLTLDQDTDLPIGYIEDFAAQARILEQEQRVAAIVPRIIDHGRPISPIRFVGGFLPKIVTSPTTITLGPDSTALNSAALVRVSALREVGGYDENFPLNNSDTAMFHRLDKAGYRIALAGKVVVQHELAIMQRRERMTVQRYGELLMDERNFWDMHMSFMARVERLVRLVGRVVKGIAGSEDAAFRRVTLNEIQKRLITRRKTRLRNQQRQIAGPHAS